MINLKINANGALKILALGAHCDDIEIGCGGTLSKLLAEHPDAEVFWVVFSADRERETEARNSADSYLKKHKNSVVEISNFRNGYFPFVAPDIKDYFEALKTRFNPDVVFTHFVDDKHQDHRTIAELTWNTFRNHLILQYEIAKYDGDLKTPNLYITLDEATVSKKTSGLMEHFKSQHAKHWFTQDLFQSLMRIRGIECASTTGFAEGFHAHKLVI